MSLFRRGVIISFFSINFKHLFNASILTRVPSQYFTFEFLCEIKVSLNPANSCALISNDQVCLNQPGHTSEAEYLLQ